VAGVLNATDDEKNLAVPVQPLCGRVQKRSPGGYMRRDPARTKEKSTWANA
jgi:hypothetical protein